MDLGIEWEEQEEKKGSALEHLGMMPRLLIGHLFIVSICSKIHLRVSISTKPHDGQWVPWLLLVKSDKASQDLNVGNRNEDGVKATPAQSRFVPAMTGLTRMLRQWMAAELVSPILDGSADLRRIFFG